MGIATIVLIYLLARGWYSAGSLPIDVIGLAPPLSDRSETILELNSLIGNLEVGFAGADVGSGLAAEGSSVFDLPVVDWSFLNSAELVFGVADAPTSSSLASADCFAVVSSAEFSRVFLVVFETSLCELALVERFRISLRIRELDESAAFTDTRSANVEVGFLSEEVWEVVVVAVDSAEEFAKVEEGLASAATVGFAFAFNSTFFTSFTTGFAVFAHSTFEGFTVDVFFAGVAGAILGAFFVDFFGASSTILGLPFFLAAT